MTRDETTRTLLDLALSLGFSEACALEPANPNYFLKVRAMCEQNRCGDVAALETATRECRRGVPVQSVGTLSASSDFEAMMAVEAAHRPRFLDFIACAQTLRPNLPLRCSRYVPKMC